MTLQSVAARIRARTINDGTCFPTRPIIREFESDPEFTAPERLKAAEAKLERVRALAEELDQPDPPEWMNETEWGPSQIARRLREALGVKP